MTPSPACMQYLRDIVHRRSAIVIDADKDYLLESRLAPLALKHHLETIDELVKQVRLDERTPLAHAVIEAMTTNETSFFRDAHPFEALKSKILPDIISARSASHSLRIWCAAASTGQEPYSIAMAIREAFPSLSSWNIQIVATDLNATVLNRARSGRFRQLEVNRGLPAALLIKYFDRVGIEWQIKDEIRNMVSFQELNLLDRWPLLGQQDVIFIRNVLIYFDLPTKRKLLGRVREAMQSDGYLVLGGAETTLNLDDGYLPVRVGPSIYYQPKSAVENKVNHADQ